MMDGSESMFVENEENTLWELEKKSIAEFLKKIQKEKIKCFVTIIVFTHQIYLLYLEENPSDIDINSIDRFFD